MTTDALREKVARLVRVACVDFAVLPGRGYHTHRRKVADRATDAILALPEIAGALAQPKTEGPTDA